MRATAPLLAALSIGVASSTAHAGGIGLMGGAGVHNVRAYYYTSDGEQGIDQQTRPNFGYGVEGLLGDRDDRIQGLLRVYINSDLPPNAPDTGSYTDAVYPAQDEQGMAHIGVMTMGAQWGLVGDPAGFQVVLNSLAGSGFATANNLEYLLLEVDAGITYALTDELQLAGNVGVAGRFRKRLGFTENAFVGVRYLFD